MAIQWQFIPPPDLETEVAGIISLSMKFQLIPESTAHGTPGCRAFIVGQHGEFMNRQMTGRVPLIYEIADMVSKGMGSENGRWKLGRVLDVPPNNRLSLLTNVSDPWLPDSQNDTLWNFGVCYAKSDGLHGYFYPSFPTIYADKTSVLSDLVSVMAMVVQTQLAVKAWAKFVPTGRLTDLELKTDAEEYIKGESLRIYGERFVVTPTVFFSPNDLETGRSFSIEQNVFCNNSRHTANYTVVARRMSELT